MLRPCRETCLVCDASMVRRTKKSRREAASFTSRRLVSSLRGALARSGYFEKSWLSAGFNGLRLGAGFPQRPCRRLSASQALRRMRSRTRPKPQDGALRRRTVQAPWRTPKPRGPARAAKWVVARNSQSSRNTGPRVSKAMLYARVNTRTNQLACRKPGQDNDDQHAYPAEPT